MYEGYRRTNRSWDPLNWLPGGGQANTYYGDDHLLVARPGLLGSQMQRIPYRFIEGFSCRGTPHYMFLNIALGLWLLALAATLAITIEEVMAAPASPATPVAIFCTAVLAAIVLVVFLLNLIGGATCRTVLYTPTQALALPNLSRIHRANPVLNELRTRIERAAGEQAVPPPQTAHVAAYARDTSPPLHPGNAPLVYLAFFASLLFTALFLGLAPWWRHMARDTIGAIFTFLAALGGLVAVAFYGRRVSSSLRRAGLLALVILLVVWYFLMFVSSIAWSGPGFDQDWMNRPDIAVDMSAGAMLLGPAVLGLLLVVAERERQVFAPPSAPGAAAPEAPPEPTAPPEGYRE